MRSKPGRMQSRHYPDETLLARLQSVRLADAAIPEQEFLQFRRLQALVYRLRLAGYDLEALQTEVLTGAAMIGRVKGRVMVTRCEYDLEITDEIASEVLPRLYPDVIWLTTNCTTSHPRVHPFPIGLTEYCGYTLSHPIIGDTELFQKLMDENPRSEKNLVLLNFNDQTHPAIRGTVRRMFAPLPFVTSAAYTMDEKGYAAYVAELRAHPFCLAPRGAGIDTHRIWECLYAGGIPIVQRSPSMRDFQDLPIFFVDRWEEAANADTLKRVRDDFYSRTWNLDKLTLSYWYGLIQILLSTPP